MGTEEEKEEKEESVSDLIAEAIADIKDAINEYNDFAEQYGAGDPAIEAWVRQLEGLIAAYEEEDDDEWELHDEA